MRSVRQIALAKVQHLFCKVHILWKFLCEINNKTVYIVRQWTSLNTHSTHGIIFHTEQEGGLGIPSIECTYFATRLSHLISMPNSDDQQVGEQARASHYLDLQRRGSRSRTPWGAGAVIVSKKVISASNIVVKATINIHGLKHELPTTNACHHLPVVQQQYQSCTGSV